MNEPKSANAIVESRTTESKNQSFENTFAENRNKHDSRISGTTAQFNRSGIGHETKSISNRSSLSSR